MSQSMLEELAGALGGPMLGQLAGSLGADNAAIGKGVAAALPALIGGLAKNSSNADGAASLFKALGSHDGSILDSLGAVLGGSPWAQQAASRDGDRILGHVLGGARPQVEEQVAKTSGLGMGIVRQLLPLLAPIVLGYIGKRMRGGTQAQLAQSLNEERAAVTKNDSGLGGILSMLDGSDSKDQGGGLLDMAGDLLSGPAGKAILSQLLRK